MSSRIINAEKRERIKKVVTVEGGEEKQAR
jgi:hypothetical protein